MRMKLMRVSLTSVVVASMLALGACGGAKVGSGSEASSASSSAGKTCADTSGDSVKVGFLNSLSGTMAISEKTVSDSLNMAVSEINADGGVLGKKIEVDQQDGQSEPTKFAEKAKTLIEKDCVAAVFGGWTSASRKAMLPVFEADNSLLFYPVQYEGLESSKNIFYTGAAPNQQIVPALDYLKKQGLKKLFLVGSDYVFPQTANKIVKAYAAANDMEVVGEEYTPLGGTDFSTIVNKLKSSGAQAVVNTLNGDSNVAFFKEYKNAGMKASEMPVISMSIAEEEAKSIGADFVEGQLTAWNYYQTLDTDANKKFVADFKAKYGDDRVTSDPMEAAYTSVYLWKLMVEKAKSFDTADIQKAADGVSFEAPEGKVVVDGENHHIYKTSYIGEIGADGLITSIADSGESIKPDPYLKSYSWAKDLS